MPGNNSAALRDYYDFSDDDEQPIRSATATPQPAPAYRVAGSSGQLSRRVEIPVPLPSEPEMPVARPPRPPATRPNVPPPASRYAQSEMRPAYRQSQALAPRPRPRPQVATPMPAPNGSSLRLAFWGAGILVALVASYLLVSVALSFWQNWQDDLNYGRPRMSRLEAKVGHNETATTKTLFIAQNIRGQLSIIEIPGGDASKTRVIIGPQLFGKDRDLVPVKLQVKDVNSDGQPDLIATAQEQNLVYINENGNFRPINEQERAKIKTVDD
jgi:hypothetical protein